MRNLTPFLMAMALLAGCIGQSPQKSLKSSQVKEGASGPSLLEMPGLITRCQSNDNPASPVTIMIQSTSEQGRYSGHLWIQENGQTREVGNFAVPMDELGNHFYFDIEGFNLEVLTDGTGKVRMNVDGVQSERTLTCLVPERAPTQ